MSLFLVHFDFYLANYLQDESAPTYYWVVIAALRNTVCGGGIVVALLKKLLRLLSGAILPSYKWRYKVNKMTNNT